jgi:SNF2 family DNA or RNA helicase
MEKYKYKTEPYEHQRKALIAGADKNEFAYFMEMGTGKTKVTIDNLAYLYYKKKINLVVVIAPNSVYHNWKNEIDIHCPCKTAIYIHKVNKNFEVTEDKLNFFLINVEAFSHASGVKTLESIVNLYSSSMCVVIDEATSIKNRQAKRTKNICKVSQKALYKRILTGSPITKSPLDLFSQCEFLKPGILGFTNFYAFRARYSVMKQIQIGANKNLLIPIYYQHLGELENKIKSFSFRVRKDECLDLPPKIYERRDIKLSDQQIKLYNSLKENCRAIIEDEMASYNNKLTEILKLQQVCNGFLKTDDGETKELTNSKLTELINILDEVDGKVIIWANFVYNIETIIKTLKDKFGQTSVVSIYGDVAVEARNSAVVNFQENDKVRFFVGNPSTGGYGLNLTKASTVIYFSNSFNLEIRQQSEDRAHRIGQENKVTYIDLIAKGTIDEFVLKSLNQKLTLSAQTLGEEVLKFL